MIRVNGGARCIRLLLITAGTLIVLAGEAAAQCQEPTPTISGPSAMCSGQIVELFGPFDMTEYLWGGPSGFTASTSSISVSEPGTYTLSVRNGGTCWSPTAQFGLSLDAPTPPVITGVDSVCANQTVELCGPSGMAEYIWFGPGGFADATQCVTVSETGTYTLATRMEGSACYSNDREFVLRQGSCTVEPPPPPPPGRPSCPMPASWWSRQCWPAPNAGTRFTGSGLTTVAACVDGHGTLFQWADPRYGLNRVLSDRHGLRDRALRQFAAVAANVCAWTSEVPQSRSLLVGLDPARSLSLESTTATTVGAWLTQADADLTMLDSRNRPRRYDARKAYRRIIRTGWAINHGFGVGSVCETSARTVPVVRVADDEDDVEDETLEDEVSIETGMAALEIEAAAPNPFRNTTRFVYYVGDTGGQAVELGIYDITGRRIRKLLTANLPSGPHEISWDGRDDNGRGVNNGVYFVNGRVGPDRVSSTLTLLK